LVVLRFDTPPASSFASAAFVFVLLILVPPAYAQTETWSLDSSRSTASVWLVSSSNPDGLNYGVATVAGTVSFDPAKPSALHFTLNIFPADQAQALLNPDGTWRVGSYAQLSRYTVFTFTSKSPRSVAADKLRYTGDLTITHVVRTAPAEGSVSYSGPRVSAVPDETSLTREVTLSLQNTAPDITYGWKVGWMEMKGAVTLALEDAPALWDWIADSVWPPVILDRRCWTQNTSLRDYRGLICAGDAVDRQPQKEKPRTTIGTIDYAGPQRIVPEGINEFRLELDLRLREPK